MKNNGSLMEEHPRFQMLFQMFKIYRFHVQMLMFGGESKKDTWLYSSSPFIDELLIYRPWVPQDVLKGPRKELATTVGCYDF